MTELERAGVGEEELNQASSLSELDPHDHAGLIGHDRKQDIELKRDYARTFRWLVLGQLAIINIIFFLYASFGHGWEVPTPVMEVYLVATFVELVGIVLVVTRYLFPRRDV